jgi:hypothetical protein
MEIRQDGERWLGRKNKKAKTWENVSDIIHFDGDFASVMGKAGRTSFHSYLGKSGNRWIEMYGVTSLLGYWGEKEKLLQWGVDKAVDYIQEKCSHNEAVLKDARSAHKRSLEDAGAHGTDKHALVETYINGVLAGDVSVPFDESIKEFVEWSLGHTFIASEMPLRSTKLWVAGTCDFIVEIDGKRYMGDLKTSNYVSFKNFIQCGAYALMYEEMGYGKIDGIIIVHMPRDGGFKVHTEMDVDNYKKAFESLVRLVKLDKSKSYQLYN